MSLNKYHELPFFAFLFCFSDIYVNPFTIVSSLNQSCIANVNANVATVLRIRLIHAIHHVSL